MFDSSVAPAVPRAAVPSPAVQQPRQPQAVISERAVMLGTAAAAVQPAEASGHHIAAALSAILHHSIHREHHSHPHYPPRLDAVLEHAAMEREMHRL